MPNWIDIGDASEILRSEPTTVQAGGEEVVVCQVEGKPFAVANSCPHAGLPLSDGELRGCVLTCPYHGYAYNVQTGENIDMPEYEPPVKTYPIKVEDGKVFVEAD